MYTRIVHILLIGLAVSRAFTQYSDTGYGAGSYGSDAGMSQSYGYSDGGGYGYGDGYGYGYGYDDDYALDSNYGYDDQYYDSYGYYGDEDAAYYEYYGYYADDFQGYEYGDYYDEYAADTVEDCYVDASGRPVLSNKTVACDIRITGVDTQTTPAEASIDGVYQLSNCYNGKPMYRRQLSPRGEERALWYSSAFGDWDVSRGAQPDESTILMYGGDMEHAGAFAPVGAALQCANGEATPSVNTWDAGLRAPLLSDDEIAKKYESIYVRYARKPEPHPGVSFTAVVVMVMVGLTVVLAIPYFLLGRKGGAAKGKGGGGGGGASSFAQILQHSKKRQSGHVN